MKNHSLDKLILGHLNISSLRNKFNSLKSTIGRNISETKQDDAFPSAQFKMGFIAPLKGLASNVYKWRYSVSSIILQIAMLHWDYISWDQFEKKKIKWITWDKVFKSGVSKFRGRQPLKSRKEYDFLKAVFRKIYLVHSWILCPI